MKLSKTKLIIIVISAFLLIAVIVVLAVFLTKQTFPLSEEFYGKDETFINANVDEIRNLIKDKKSFAVFVYQPACRTSEDFEKIVQKYGSDHKISFLKTNFSDLKSSGLVPELKYYPSMLLYRDGKLVTFLRAGSDEDVKVYQNEADFVTWWQKYVKS